MGRVTSMGLQAGSTMVVSSSIFSVISCPLYFGLNVSLPRMWFTMKLVLKDRKSNASIYDIAYHWYEVSFAAVDAMDLQFLNPYLDSIGAPSFLKGSNFAAAGSTILPAIASSVSPFSFGIQVSQFLRFKQRVIELLAKGILCFYWSLNISDCTLPQNIT